MNLITVAIFFTCYFFVQPAVAAYAKCGVGKWADTQCVELSKCWQFNDPMEEFHKTDPSKHASFLINEVRPAMCGFDKNLPKVCCPNSKSKKPKSKVTNNNNVNNANCGSIVWHKSLSPDGSPAELEEFPWLALLEYQTRNGKIFGCGGVLISDRHVLTAAHCLDPTGPKLTGVRLGEHDLRTAQDCMYDPYSPYCSKKVVDVGIEKEIPHEKYSFLRGPSDFDPLSHDIAILKLNRSVITNVIKPICLPDWREAQATPSAIRIDVVGKYLTAGWGVKPTNIYPRSLVKLMSRLKEVPKNYCDHKYRHTLHEDVICVLSKTPKTACIADSGGPLMGFNKYSKMIVTGIYSPVDTQACWKSGVPSTFVDVRKYIDWIRLKMHY